MSSSAGISNYPNRMTRRDLLIKMALAMGATVVGPRLFAADFGKRPDATAPFSPADLALLDEIGDTIIPATGTPGAKSIGIGAFIAMMVSDCYYPHEQAAFKEGLAKLAATFRVEYGEDFIRANAPSRTEFLNSLDREQHAYMAELSRPARGHSRTHAASGIHRPAPHYFRMMKDLVLLGYFTSEIASTQILGWLEVPGRFDGNVLYKKAFGGE